MKKYLVSVLYVIVILIAASAQEVSGKQEIAVFSLSYSDWSTPSGALGIVDQQIIEVLSNIGRFNVRGLDLRLKAEDVAEFTSMVRDVNEANLVIDDKYRLGEAVFTEAVFEELVGSFIIVIPSLTHYDSLVEAVDSGALWQVELQTSFSFVLVKDSSTIAQFSINTYGSGDTQRAATLDAAAAISGQLQFELKKIDQFRLKSGIIEVLPRGRVIIELGEEMGVVKGDEFSIVTTETLESGHVIQNNSGLLVVSDVKQDVSFGKILYNDGVPEPGAQLAEVPRLGTELSLYGNLLFDIDYLDLCGGIVGVKSVFSRGFYDFRPIAGIEIPFVDEATDSTWPGIPVSIYGGGELLWYFGRFQIEPSLALGVTGLIPVDEYDVFDVTHFGGRLELALNWMASDNFKIFLNGGYTYWWAPTASTTVSSYGGIFGGLGGTFKL
ncbi:MAG: hypothetical protein PQJ61_16520 [Spirochaetales bacterium]|uniref:Uncharacterized protein n=1 Tax=Candidatus Thalassospirochaeta sargassi TaxID=3119039 RepID=A0AAJ1IHQ9_9SPIO|nr:hypothetical protein [Spirochaetales bacterium]